MVIISILPKTYTRLIEQAESKKETIDATINRLINGHEIWGKKNKKP